MLFFLSKFVADQFHLQLYTVESVIAKNVFTMPTVHLLDYVAGNVRSLVNAIEKLGYEVEWVRTPEDVEKAEVQK